jgi:hypothetical protein
MVSVAHFVCSAALRKAHLRVTIVEFTNHDETVILQSRN